MFPVIARADVGLVVAAGSFSATGTLPAVSLSGQGSCTVTLSGNGAGLSVTVQLSSDNLATWATASNVGSSGIITANGAFNGTITVPSTAIRLNVTAITSGTENYYIVCGGTGTQLSGGTGQAPLSGGSVTVPTGPNQSVAIHATNGVTLDAVREGGTGADVVPTVNVGAIYANAFGYIYNGATWDRIFSCNLVAAISVNTAATTQLVALSSGKTIYVCGVNFVAAGTTNVTLEYGTGVNCGTGTTAISGAYPLAAQSGVAMAVGLGSIFRTPASQALCIVNSAAVQVSGFISYTQY